jgi:hypothetical protein
MNTTKNATVRSRIRRCVSLLPAAMLLITGSAAGQGLQQSSDFNKGGRTAFQFLKIGVGARQAGLGESGIASVRDVSGVFWNPATISGVGSTQVALSYARWFADMNLTAGAVGFRWNGVGVFALSVASLDYGDIPEAVVTPGRGGDGRTGSTFTGSDLMAGIAYAREFTDRLAIGINAKFISETLFDSSVNSFALDVGTSYGLGFYNTRLAMSAQNFSRGVRWLGDNSDRQEGYDIPLVFRIGLSTALIGEDNAFFHAGPLHHVTLSAEAVNTNDYSERLHVGAEYEFSDFLSLRGGYRMNYAEGNWAVGFGLHPKTQGLSFRLDYAYVHYEYLNSPHRLTVLLTR